MASPAAIGGGILGVGVIGVGTAYAAGAFTSKYVNFQDYVDRNGLVYVGGISDEKSNSIKKLLDEDRTGSSNGYRSKLSGKWSSMNQSDLTGNQPEKPAGEPAELFKSSNTELAKSTEIAKFTKAWCETKKKNKAPAAVGKWTEDTLKKDSDWQTFEKVCLV
ncbi:hypothetical protein [Candidatus Mycoplasma haematohominis]|uniref:Uncharacterized protein n=1 Tax=Candidatus Mycoplasma haematohominis TaxID=1494318 RepID=A0A478FSW3_9MOLU|nr:hypothetical protein [Candidatus Mycoplasma haemohominis]GCE63100.1 hypothetical protein MHSWG343_00780 [Candidatus Mycoplasma haemohominis]